MVVFVLVDTFAFTDWVMSLEPHWYSTIFCAYFLVCQGLCAMALGTYIATKNFATGQAPYTAEVVTETNRRDWGNVLGNPGRGLYGAIVVGGRGTTYTDPVSGADLSDSAGWRVDAHPINAPAYRDFSLFMQDEDEIIGTAQMPYTEHVAGVVGLNYRSEPLLPRLADGSSTSTVFSPAVHGDPATPLLEAFAGDPVRLHVLVPFSEQAHVFSVEGHRWPLEPGRPGTDMRDAYQIGGLEVLNALLAYGAGGRDGLAGDYLYGDHREPFREAGLWGLMRVYDHADATASLVPLQAP